jgi:signal transduction histidine kinase
MTYLIQQQLKHIVRLLYSEEIVICDKDMLLTILRNLITNALKFTNEGGKIVFARVNSNQIEIMFPIGNIR